MDKRHHPAGPNLWEGTLPRHCWVWADLREPLVRSSLRRWGEFFSVAEVWERVAALPFVENPGFLGRLSPFGLNVLRDYTVEYRLELRRLRRFAHHPSRLGAIFLFANEAEAWRYAQAYPERTAQRHLLRVVTRGRCRCSWHDGGWIELLRSGAVRRHRLDEMADAYWRGEAVHPPVECHAEVASIWELLLLGRIAVGEIL